MSLPTIRAVRLCRDINELPHATPPTASRSSNSSSNSAPYSSATDRGAWGSLVLPGLFFRIGRSSTLGWHFSQNTTPAPRSRTHNPPQCSQYFNSTRTWFLLSSRLLLITYLQKDGKSHFKLRTSYL